MTTPIKLDVSLSYGLARKGLPASVSFKRWVAATLQHINRNEPAEVCIRLVDEHEGLHLNAQYRDKHYATNVLSFPVDLPAGIKLPLIGDLAICAPVVQKEAQAQNKPLRHHYAHLTVHGILHLIGYDHIKDDEAEKMEALERQILASLNIPDPYKT